MTTRRREFKASAILLGKTMYGTAADLGVSYNHLVLVLDGKRSGSQRLNAAIADIVASAAQCITSPTSVPRSLTD